MPKISHSSITADSKVLEPAIYLNNPPDYPKNLQIIFLHLLWQFSPLLWVLIYLDRTFKHENNKFNRYKYRTDIPIISGLGKNYMIH